MGRAHDLVGVPEHQPPQKSFGERVQQVWEVLPALPIAFLPHAIFIAQLAEAVGERLPPPRQIGETFEKMTHRVPPVLAGATSTFSPITGRRRTSVM
jgi:hypothetical protein